MKKRLLGLLLCLVMLFSILPMASFAEGETGISHVEAAGVVVPAAGEHPVIGWTTDASAGYIVINSYSQYWYNETDRGWMTAEDVFEAGKTYQLILGFQPKEGCSFADEDVMTASLTGIDPDAYEVTRINKAGGGSYPNRTVYYEFTVPGETEPESGAGTFTVQPADVTVRVGEEATYSFVFTGDVDDTYDSSLMYKNGDTWMDWNYVGPESGVVCSGVLNAESTAVSRVFKIMVRSAGKWVESNEFTVTWSDGIFHVEAAGVVVPVAGEHPVVGWTTDASAGYTVINSYSQYWYNETDGGWMTTEDVFEAGKTYQLILGFQPKEGYSFADEDVMTASLTGVDPDAYEVTRINKAGGGSYPNRTVYYQFVALEATSVMLGDVNGDGRISVADYTLVLAHVKGTKLITDAAKLKAADVNGDGKVSVADYTLILAHVKGTKLLA